MSRFENLSQSIWYCHYHIVWVPKYRHRVLTGTVVAEANLCIRSFSDRKDYKIVEVQIDHVHLLVMIPPKIAISDYTGMIKGRTAIRVFNKF